MRSYWTRSAGSRRRSLRGQPWRSARRRPWCAASRMSTSDSKKSSPRKQRLRAPLRRPRTIGRVSAHFNRSGSRSSLVPELGARRRVGQPTHRRPYDAEALLDVAVRVFNERGYDGTSMDDVARAAGITKASIYYHVAGKEELLERGIRRALDALFSMLDESGASRGPAERRLRYVMLRTVEIMSDQLAEVALLLRVRGNTPIERWALEQRRDFTRRITALVQAAMDDGSL